MRKILKVSKTFAKKYLPRRRIDAHKGDSGSVLIIGGGSGLYGAGILSALAATRCGVGYTHLMTDLTRFPWLKFPDFIVHPVLLKELKIFLKKKSSIVFGIGPGLGNNVRTKKFLLELLKHSECRVVLDADALTVLSEMKNKNKNLKLPSHWILCPHEGEMARLMNTTSILVNKNRKKILLEAQTSYGCVILLKGPETLIADGNHLALMNAGSKALAKAGTGDVLLGMICALLAQGLNGLEAASTASYLHAYSGKLWTAEGADYLGLRPVDLIEILPKAIHSLRTRA